MLETKLATDGGRKRVLWLVTHGVRIRRGYTEGRRIRVEKCDGPPKLRYRGRVGVSSGSGGVCIIDITEILDARRNARSVTAAGHKLRDANAPEARQHVTHKVQLSLILTPNKIHCNPGFFDSRVNPDSVSALSNKNGTLGRWQPVSGGSWNLDPHRS